MAVNHLPAPAGLWFSKAAERLTAIFPYIHMSAKYFLKKRAFDRACCYPTKIIVGKVNFCKNTSSKYYMVHHKAEEDKKIIYGFCQAHDLPKEDFSSSYIILKSNADEVDIYLVMSE